MPSNTFAYRAAICLIWALALWHSWICRGLFVDGFAFLVQIVTYEWFFDFYPPRLYAMIAGQLGKEINRHADGIGNRLVLQINHARQKVEKVLLGEDPFMVGRTDPIRHFSG